MRGILLSRSDGPFAQQPPCIWAPRVREAARANALLFSLLLCQEAVAQPRGVGATPNERSAELARPAPRRLFAVLAPVSSPRRWRCAQRTRAAAPLCDSRASRTLKED